MTTSSGPIALRGDLTPHEFIDNFRICMQSQKTSFTAGPVLGEAHIFNILLTEWTRNGVQVIIIQDNGLKGNQCLDVHFQI
jgi:hypothetical protein